MYHPEGENKIGFLVNPRSFWLTFVRLHSLFKFIAPYLNDHLVKHLLLEISCNYPALFSDKPCKLSCKETGAATYVKDCHPFLNEWTEYLLGFMH